MDGSSSRLRRIAVAFLAAMPTLALLPTAAGAAAATHDPTVGVIVRAPAGHLDDARRLVTQVGGKVTLDLAIIDGFAADVPGDTLDVLAASPVVASVTRDASVHMNSDGSSGNNSGSGDGSTSTSSQLGSLYKVARMVGADAMWDAGYDGDGIDVAVLDTGVAPVPGLVGHYVNGPDLSLDAMGAGTAGLDAFGHGTAMASIIAGRDPGVYRTKDLKDASKTKFIGVAPGARVVNIKVGAFDGASDVSQVIAGIDWVVQHAHDGGRNIRVLNLSFGTDGVQNYQLDPLTYATEVAWRKGIVVVVSAGNTGFGTPKLNNPAYDPFVMAVGASHPNGTEGTGDDYIADFSSRGELSRRPDFMAPGVQILGLRSPGSFLDEEFPAARIGTRYLRGSGTSQAAAVMSGAVALLLDRYPTLTPDMVKAAFAASGAPLKTSKGVELEKGAERIDVKAATGKVWDVITGKIKSAQQFVPATGLGSLDASRGSSHLTDADGTVLQGEVDIFGTAWDPAVWAGRTWTGSSWNGDTWLGHTWSGSTWSGRTWTGNVWDGRTWTGSTWNGSTWNGSTWSGRTWTGSSWSGSTWSGRSWSGSSWSGSSWSSSDWNPTDAEVTE